MISDLNKLGIALKALNTIDINIVGVNDANIHKGEEAFLLDSTTIIK